MISSSIDFILTVYNDYWMDADYFWTVQLIGIGSSNIIDKKNNTTMKMNN
jgi:hypothetical protein